MQMPTHVPELRQCPTQPQPLLPFFSFLQAKGQGGSKVVMLRLQYIQPMCLLRSTQLGCCFLGQSQEPVPMPPFPGQDSTAIEHAFVCVLPNGFQKMIAVVCLVIYG